eukprot:TRINITY_DN1825_c0_g1_i1.p1 TRINITY_DN1825_c0_g1~~TRINITY_DN1825_c0_g1_i1.p1  ORF type:complete len:711 (-),score=107.76 TRINITY_DN1825_c0_g1_i1:89-2221(-)
MIIMEYASGGELKEYVMKKTRLDESEARDIFLQLLNAVQHCHTLGIIHRDLKLENVLFADPSKTKIKVVDFGIAGLIRNNVADKSKAGSLKYMAPEVLTEENMESRPSLDIWSMGCMLYAMVCGELPFSGKVASEVIEKIKVGTFDFPKDFKLTYHCRDLIQKMLTVDYNNRITAQEVREHPWIEGASPGSSPQKNNTTEDPPLMIKLTLQNPPAGKRNERSFLKKNHGRCPTGVKAAPKNFCLPMIGKYNNNKKALKRASMENKKEMVPAYKPRVNRMSLICNNPLQERSEQGNAKLWLLTEHEKVPSFMQPIRRTKEEKQLINSLAKEARENIVLRRPTVPRHTSKEKCRSASRCNVVRKDSMGLKLLAQQCRYFLFLCILNEYWQRKQQVQTLGKYLNNSNNNKMMKAYAEEPTSPQSSSRKIHKQDFVPLKVCAKYTPPSIAILYALTRDKHKKYLHEIPLPMLSSDETAADLYHALVRSEPIYLNPKIVSKGQIIRIIEQIWSKSAKLPNNNNNNDRCSTAGTVTNSNNEDFVSKKMGEVVVPMISNKKDALKQELRKELLKASETDSVEVEEQEYSEDFIEESQGKSVEKLPAAADKRSVHKEAEEPEVDYEQLDAGMEEGLPEGFQRVFVEDLGEELLMDPNGNLYDLNGNLIGQAASDDEEEEGTAANGLNDYDDEDKYFENSADKNGSADDMDFQQMKNTY